MEGGLDVSKGYWCQIADRRDAAAYIKIRGFVAVLHGRGGTWGRAPGNLQWHACMQLKDDTFFLLKGTSHKLWGKGLDAPLCPSVPTSLKNVNSTV